MQLLTRLLLVPLLLALAACFALVTPTPAHAATKNAGIADLTPYGGYLGNYLAPDGSRVYCIDSPLDWPSGETSGPSPVDSLVTTWGAELPVSALRKLNYVLLGYGQTDDPVQAAAVAAFVNAYTSGWARDLGAGYAAGAWYLNGNAEVTAVYDAIWADAEANGDPVGSASVTIDPSAGTVSVASSLADATGTLTLAGAVRADTAESSFAVGAAETVPIRGVPSDDARDYAISADVSYTAPVVAAPSLVLYTTPQQQRTIRGGNPGTVAFSASASTEAIPLDFTPVLTTVVASASVEVGEQLIDRVTVSLADGSRPWRVRSDGSPVALVAEGVLYGPLSVPPARAAAAPASAPVAARQTLTITGPGDYSSEGHAAREPGYYTWVWSIVAASQDAAGLASLPLGYAFVSEFGDPVETHFVTSPPERLAATGEAPGDGVGAAALAGAGLVALGGLLSLASARSRRAGNTDRATALGTR